MSFDFDYTILNEPDKKVKITYKGKSLTFRLKVKRAFIVLKAILERHPDFLNIHELDNIYSDPNRAHSDLRIEDGFANFLIEEKDERRVMLVKLDLDKLFRVYQGYDAKKPICLAPPDMRLNLTASERNRIYAKFSGRCNITGIRVLKKIKDNYFFKHAMIAEYDHRKPLFKGGDNSTDNWQLVSRLANKEKNKICNVCSSEECEHCALAYPERFSTIKANGQNISELRKCWGS